MYSPARTAAIQKTTECEFGRRVALAILTHDVREDSSAGIEELLQDLRQYLVDAGVSTAYPDSHTGRFTTLFRGQPGDEDWMDDFLDWVMRGCHDNAASVHHVKVRVGIRMAMEYHLAVRDWHVYQTCYGNLLDAEHRIERIQAEEAGDLLVRAAVSGDMDPLTKAVQTTRMLMEGMGVLRDMVNDWTQGKK